MSEQSNSGGQEKNNNNETDDFSRERGEVLCRIDEVNKLLSDLQIEDGEAYQKNEKRALKKRIKKAFNQDIASKEDMNIWLRSIEGLEKDVADFCKDVEDWKSLDPEQKERIKEKSKQGRKMRGGAAARDGRGKEGNSQPVVDANSKTSKDTKTAPEDLGVEPALVNLENKSEEEDISSGSKNNTEVGIIIEKQEKIEEIRALVREKRRSYAREDYANTNHFKRLKSILGLGDKQNPFNSKETFAYQKYQEALNELRNLEIQSLKDDYSNIDSLPENKKETILAEMKQRMGELATFFGLDEKIELAGARTDARTEAWVETKAGKFADVALKKSAEMINWYRKLDPKIKIAISGTLLAAGGVAAITGAVGIASTVASAKMIQRCIGGTVTGAGIAGGLEARSRKKAKNKIEDDKNEIIGKEEWTEKFNALNDYCDKEIKTFHESLQKEKNGATKRKLLGAGVGVFVGSGAAADCLRYGFSWVGHTETFGKVKDVATGFWKNSGASGIVRAGIESVKTHNPFSSPVVEIPDSESTANTSSITENMKPVEVISEVNLDPNESLLVEAEKSFADLNSPKTVEVEAPDAKIVDVPNPEVNANIIEVEIPKGGSMEKVMIQQLQEQGISKKEAGKFAHRMALKYAEEHNISFAELNHVEVGDVLKLEINPNNPEGMKIANLERVSVANVGGLDREIAALSAKEVENIQEIAEKFGGDDLSSQISEAKNLVGEEYEQAYCRIFANVAKNIFNGHETSLEALREIDAKEYIESGYGNNPKIGKLLEYNSHHSAGNFIEINTNENMKNWTMRMIGEMLKSGGIEMNGRPN